MQRILREQVIVLQRAVKCGPDFEALLRELWTLYLHAVTADNTQDMLRSSLWLSQNVHLALIYHTFLLLRRPIMIVDIYNWVERSVIPYRNVRHIVPMHETTRLSVKYRNIFKPQSTPTMRELRALMQDMARFLVTRVQITIPVVNEERLFIRMFQGLRLAPESYLYRNHILKRAMCHDLSDWLEYIRKVEGTSEDNETILLALCVVCTVLWLLTLGTESTLSFQYRVLWAQSTEPIEGPVHPQRVTDDDLLAAGEDQITEFFASYAKDHVVADDADVEKQARETAMLATRGKY